MRLWELKNRWSKWERAVTDSPAAKEKSAMRLWKLEIRERLGYGCARGFVVRAESREHAREVAAQQAGDEGPEVWLDNAKSYCRWLAHKGRAGVILRDFCNV